MNAPELELGIAEFLMGVLTTAGYPDVPVRTAQAGGELEPFESCVVVSCEDHEHEVGPLHVAEISALVKTPCQTGDVAAHRALAKVVTEALGKHAPVHVASLAAAVFSAAQYEVTGTFLLGAQELREDHRWVNGPLVRIGFCEEGSDPGDGGTWNAPRFTGSVAAGESEAFLVTLPVGIWFFVARVAITDEDSRTVGWTISGLARRAGDTVTVLGDQHVLLGGEDAEYGDCVVDFSGSNLRITVSADGDDVTVSGNVQFYGGSES